MSSFLASNNYPATNWSKITYPIAGIHSMQKNTPETIYLHLGTNLGDRVLNLQQALESLQEEVGPILRQSSFYETDAWGIEDQPDFVNLALEMKTQHPPRELLDILLNIEQKMGRVRKKKWGERLIDIDLLFYGQQVIDWPNLQVPHPGIPSRNFVLIPMLEIAPEWIHPTLQQTIEALYWASKDQGEVRMQ